MSKGTTKVLECSCDHEYQDKVYGARRRLHNPGNKGYKCTVCNKLKSVAAEVTKK